MKYNYNIFSLYAEILLYWRGKDQIRIDSIEFLYYPKLIYKLEMIFLKFSNSYYILYIEEKRDFLMNSYLKIYLS